MTNLAIIAISIFVATTNAAYLNDNPDNHPTAVQYSIGQSRGYVEESVISTGVMTQGWELQFAQRGNRNNKTSDETTDMYSFTRVFRPNANDLFGENLNPTMRIGPAYVENSAFVGNTNFHLGVGVEWNSLIGIEWNHYSSGAVHSPNTGEDDIRVKMNVEF